MKDLSTSRQWMDAYTSYRESCEEEGSVPEFATYQAWRENEEKSK